MALVVDRAPFILCRGQVSKHVQFCCNASKAIYLRYIIKIVDESGECQLYALQVCRRKGDKLVIGTCRSETSFRCGDIVDVIAVEVPGEPEITFH